MGVAVVVPSPGPKNPSSITPTVEGVASHSNESRSRPRPRSSLSPVGWHSGERAAADPSPPSAQRSRGRGRLAPRQSSRLSKTRTSPVISANGLDMTLAHAVRVLTCETASGAAWLRVAPATVRVQILIAYVPCAAGRAGVGAPLSTA